MSLSPFECSGYEKVECGRCGIVFCPPGSWVTARRRDHTDFYCPNGHPISFEGESDVEKAQRSAREAQAKTNEAEHARLAAERERDKIKAELESIKARSDAGVCLRCNRTFSNLARHNKTKHPAAIEAGKTRKQISASVN